MGSSSVSGHDLHVFQPNRIWKIANAMASALPVPLPLHSHCRHKRISAIINVTFAVTNALPLPVRLRTRNRCQPVTDTNALPLGVLYRRCFCYPHHCECVAGTVTDTSALLLPAYYRHRHLIRHKRFAATLTNASPLQPFFSVVIVVTFPITDA